MEVHDARKKRGKEENGGINQGREREKERMIDLNVMQEDVAEKPMIEKENK